jgi:hypothetical protein
MMVREVVPAGVGVRSPMPQVASPGGAALAKAPVVAMAATHGMTAHTSPRALVAAAGVAAGVVGGVGGGDLI